MFKLAKSSAIKSRTQAINQLKAVLVAADPTLREALSGLRTPILIRHCAQLPTGAPSDATSAATWTLRLLARRIMELTGEIDDLNQQLARAVNRHTPQLLARPGAGPDGAAALLITAGTTRAAGQRSLLRRVVRRQSGPGVLPQDHPPAPEPRRRPASQRRAVPHHAAASALGSTHPRRPRPAHRPRQDPP